MRTILRTLIFAVFLTCFAIGSVQADTPGVVPDLNIWVGTWFKVTLTSNVYHFSNIGVKPRPSAAIPESGGTSYMKITEWNTTTPGEEYLVVDVYAKESGSWVLFDTMNIYYFAGNSLKFVGSAKVDDPTGTSLNLLFVFTGKWNPAKMNFKMNGSTKLSTMGSSIFEIDDFPGSTERWAGTAKLSGPMVPVSKLPLELQGL
jgi:hypothetical protein